MRRGRVVGVVIAIILCVVCALRGGNMAAAEDTEQRAQTGTETQRIAFEVEGQKFRIPIGFMWDPGQRNGGRVDGINVHAVLPDIAPYSRETHDKFFERGQGEIILFQVNSPAHLKPLAQIRSEALSNTDADTPVEERDGFRIYRVRRDWPRRLVYEPTGTGDDIAVIHCDVDGRWPFPSCKVITALDGNLILRFSLGKPWIAQWEEIRAKLRSRIAEWRR